MQRRFFKYLAASPIKPLTADQIRKRIGLPDEIETVFKVCEHLAANPDLARSVKTAWPSRLSRRPYQRLAMQCSFIPKKV